VAQRSAPLEANPAPVPSQSTTPPPQGRRLSRNLLDFDDDASHTSAPSLDLSEALATEVWANFTQQLRDEQKNIPLAHFNSMKMEIVLPDEVKLICPGQLEHVTARNYKSLIQELFQAKLNKIVRIKTEIHIPEHMEHTRERILSKAEMFEAMIMKNPNLLRLKDALGMQLDL